MIILDPGHGGLINDKYVTPGKRSPKWMDGTQLFEGVFNRYVVCRLVELLKAEGICAVNIVTEQEDISLTERVERANKIYKDNPNAILLSIHANAALKEGTASGYEMFVYNGSEVSGDIAEIMVDEYGKSMPELDLRVDNPYRNYKEANFKILRETSGRAVLIECAFMDRYHPDCEMMLNHKDRFVCAIFAGILELKRLNKF